MSPDAMRPDANGGSEALHPAMDDEGAAGALLSRLRKIEGQVRGLQRMVESGRPCDDVLMQVSAVTHALRRVGVMALGCAITEAVQDAVREGRDPGPEVEKLASGLARLG